LQELQAFQNLKAHRGDQKNLDKLLIEGAYCLPAYQWLCIFDA